MKGYSIIIAFVIVLSIKSIKMSSIRTTEPPLYDNYDDDYFDKNSDETENPDDEEMLSNRIRLQSTSIPDVTSQNDPTTIITTTEEPAIILSAGLSQIYSIHNKNPNKDKKLMKLLQENAGEAEPPLNCTPFKMLGSQPALLPVVTVPKCCNVGENYYFNETEKGCGAARTEFKFDLIHAVFYEGCIEDQEMNLTYIIEQKPPCAGGILYNENYGDFLYVLSNGSLLRVTEDWEFYDIINEYCLDMTYDNDEFVLSAISCHDVYGGVVHVSQIQGTVCAVFMMISVPCLVAVALIYFSIPNLNDLHGKALGLHCVCLAIGYLLLALIQFTAYREGITGFFIQYFLLAAFFWLLLMVMDISVQVWHYLPKGMEMTNYKENCRLFSYTIVAQGMPLIFVLLTVREGFSGLPSYYFRANEGGEMASQKYFIPVVTVILIFAIAISIFTECGYSKLSDLSTLSFMRKFSQRFSRQTSRVSNNTITRQISEVVKNLDPEKIEKVATMKKSTNILLAIMCITWICEIISFYFTSSRISPIMFLDIINALQGAFIFMLFVCLPGPMNIIRKYFKDKYEIVDETRQKELNEIRSALLQNGTMQSKTATIRRSF